MPGCADALQYCKTSVVGVGRIGSGQSFPDRNVACEYLAISVSIDPERGIPFS